MSKNSQESVIKQKTAGMATKILTYCALLVAMNIVLTRLLGVDLTPSMRISIGDVPTILAGLLFGPAAGAAVGLIGDFVGCVIKGQAYNPLFCAPPLLYGLCAGLFRPLLRKKVSFWRILLAIVPAGVLGSILIQSIVMAYVVNGEGAFAASLLHQLSIRIIQYPIMMTLNAFVIYLIYRSNVFYHIGIWNKI